MNASYGLYDLWGVPVLGPDPLGALFTLPAGTRVFAPKVVYDQYRDTFVLAFLGANDARRPIVDPARLDPERDGGRPRHLVRSDLER